jgi:hypothetical protein
MLGAEVVMDVVLVLASVLLVACVAAAVALNRRPRPGFRPSRRAGAGPPARPLPGAGRWTGLDASVRACDDLQAQLRAGMLSGDDYRRAMADLAASHDRRHPLPIPPES